jgi:hypothetical protein
MDISKIINDKNDAILQISEPSSQQIDVLKKAIEDVGLKTNNFCIANDQLLFANIEYLKRQVKRAVKEGTKVIFLEFESLPTQKNFFGTKTIINELKDIMPQMIVTIFKSDVEGSKNKTKIDYFSSSKELLDELRNRYEGKPSIDVSLNTESSVSSSRLRLR